MLVVGLGIVKDVGFVKSITRSSEKRELMRGPLYYVVVIVLCTTLWRTNYIGNKNFVIKIIVYYIFLGIKFV